MVVQIDRATFLQNQGGKETKPEVIQIRYPTLYILPSVILIPIVVGAVFALSLMQLDFGFRLLMDGAVAIAAILVLGGLYWWGGKEK